MMSKRSLWWRRARVALVLLVVAIAAEWSAAIVFALRGQQEAEIVGVSRQGDDGAFYFAATGFGYRRYDLIQDQPEWFHVIEGVFVQPGYTPPIPFEPHQGRRRILIEASGWPFRSRLCWWTEEVISGERFLTWHHPASTLAEREFTLQSGVSLSSERPADSLGRVLPVGVRWPAFVGNVGCYLAGLLLAYCLLLPVNRALRHNRRYRHGLCPLCRYDLRADYSQGCSECGWGRHSLR